MIIEVTTPQGKAMLNNPTIQEIQATKGLIAGVRDALIIIELPSDNNLGIESDRLTPEENLVMPISYNDFKAYAQMSATLPNNPLGIINLQDDMIEQIPLLAQNWRQNCAGNDPKAQFGVS